MRLLRRIGLLVALAAPAVFAAEEHGEGAAAREMIFRVLNFAILAAGVGYLIKKNAGPYFAARGEAIRQEMAEARRLLQESAERAGAIEDRLAGLDRQIAELRAAARSEIAAEHARLEQQAEQAMKKIVAQLEQDVAAAAKAARLELRSYAASLAVGLAEKKIASRITPQIQRELVGGFVRSLGG